MMYSIIRFKSSSCLCLSVTSTAQFTGKTLTVAWAIHTKDGKHLSLTNRLHFPVVCSVIDTQYDVICGKNKKSVHEPPIG